MGEHDDFWKRVDDFYERHPEIAESDRTGESYAGLERFLEKLAAAIEGEQEIPDSLEKSGEGK